jgi:hypothetical protein
VDEQEANPNQSGGLRDYSSAEREGKGQEDMMIDAKQAVKAAGDYLRSMYGDALVAQVEEVELDDAEDFWYITLSFPDPEARMLPTWPTPKLYKVFKIRSGTGEVVSMKIRDAR